MSKAEGTAGAKVLRQGFSGIAKEASTGVKVREQTAPRGPAGRGRLGSYSKSGGGPWKVWGRGCWLLGWE